MSDTFSNVVVCRIGPHQVGLPISDVVEALQMVKLDPVPTAPMYCLGTFNYRGRIVGVLDLLMRLGMEPSKLPPYRHHLIVVKDGAEHYAWAVDAMVELRTTEDMVSNLQLPAGSVARRLVRGYLVDGDETIPVIDAAKLLRRHRASLREALARAASSLPGGQ